MKQLALILGIFISFNLNLNAQSAKQISISDLIRAEVLSKTINPFLKGVIYNEGVAAIKSHMDPSFKAPEQGWIKNNVVNHIRQTLNGIEFQDGDDLFLLSDCEFVGLPVQLLDYEWIAVAIFAPEISNPAAEKGAYDPFGLDPSTNSAWGTILTDLYDELYGNPKFSDINKTIGLLLKKQPNGKYKVYPDASEWIEILDPTERANSSKINDGDFFGEVGLKAARKTVQTMLKAIRENDRKTFRNIFDEDIVRSEVWTDMRPLSKYRKLPEYLKANPQGENVIILELEDDTTLRDQFPESDYEALYLAVYKLPQETKASKVRAPSDIFNAKVWRQLGLKDLEAQDKLVGFVSTPTDFFVDLGGVDGVLLEKIIGKGNNPENFITIIVTREKGTNNFNIGMPPSLK
ncbi:MAG: hypothetical protein AAF502_13185 [Bacteroidota bacterium]